MISIVVPLYNAAETISETLHSLALQSFSEFEVIVVDDGSIDRGGQLAADFVALHASRMRYIHQANAGQAAALNRGWQEASGQYLGYLSADDVLYPEALKILNAFLDENKEIAVVYPDYDLIDANSKVIRLVHVPEYRVEDLVEHLICQPGPGAVFRRSAFEKAGGWRTDLRLIPDFEFWLRMSRFGKMARLPQNLAGFRVHESSQSFAIPSEAKSEEPVKVMTSFFDGETESSELQKELAFAWAHMLSARLHLRAGRWHWALSHLATATLSEPTILLQKRFWHLLANGAFGRLRYQLFNSTLL